MTSRMPERARTDLWGTWVGNHPGLPGPELLKELNDRFGTEFTEADKVFIEHLESKLREDKALQTSVKVNVPENARLTFDHVANDKIQELIDTNFKFYKQINDDAQFAKFFLDLMFERYQKQGVNNPVGGPPAEVRSHEPRAH
jgi:type I restriction enzyme, R subunit